MRTKALLLSAALVAAGVASSMAQSNVYSLNVVGYVNIPMVTGYNLIVNPLDSGTNTYDNLFGSSSATPLPTGASVLAWDPVGAQFFTATRTGFGTHWNPSTNGAAVAPPGQGLFINLNNPQTNTFVGTVMQGNLTNAFGVGYNLVGNIAPVGGAPASIGLTNVPTGDSVLQWDNIGQQYITHTKIGFGSGWNPTVPNIGVGEGFFLNANNAYNWTQNFVVQ